MLSAKQDRLVSRKSAICKILVNDRLKHGLGRAGQATADGLVRSSARTTVSAPREILLSGFQQTLLGFFLALDAMASPGYGVKALGINLFAAGDALSEAAFADAGESAIDHVEQLAVVIALAEKKFLVVRTGGAVGDVLRGLIVDRTAVLLIADNHVAQFLAPGFQFFSERL
jgi:hypothetical protein